jgi:hypothetical protein
MFDFEKLFEHSEESLRSAYGQGVRDYDKADFTDRFLHNVVDAIYGELHIRDKKLQSYEAGWHDRRNGKVKWERSELPTVEYSTLYPGAPLFSSGQAHGISIILRLFVLGFLLYTLWLCWPVIQFFFGILILVIRALSEKA